MTEKKGFWRWWLTKGSKADVAFKLLLIYSSVISIIFMFAIPILYPILVYRIDGLHYTLIIIHGWFICLVFCFTMAIKCEVDEYKEE